MHFSFFFNDTATTEIYTLSLHDALPISDSSSRPHSPPREPRTTIAVPPAAISTTVATNGSAGIGRRVASTVPRSEEHTSELQSRQYLVCRLLLEKKKNSKICKLDIQ